MKTPLSLSDVNPEIIDRMTDEEIADITYNSLNAFCIMLEEKGIPADYIDAVLLGLFSMRMSENASRDEFEEMLQDALDDPWPDTPTYH